MTLEQGKPLTESKGEVAYALPSSNGSAKGGQTRVWDTIPQHQADKRICNHQNSHAESLPASRRWNFPLA